jgi:hypothetical protein
MAIRLLDIEDNPESSDIKVTEGNLEMPSRGAELAVARFVEKTGGEPGPPENVLATLKTLSDDSSPSDEENIFHLARHLAVSKKSDPSTLPFRCITVHPLNSEQSYAFLFTFPAQARESTPVTLYD